MNPRAIIAIVGLLLAFIVLPGFLVWRTVVGERKKLREEKKAVADALGQDAMRGMMAKRRKKGLAMLVGGAILLLLPIAQWMQIINTGRLNWGAGVVGVFLIMGGLIQTITGAKVR